MQQTGFWANVSLIVASLVLLLAWGRLPLFTIQQVDVIERLSAVEEVTQSAAPVPSRVLYGNTVFSHLDLLDSTHLVNDTLFQMAWLLVASAGIGGLLCGSIALWWPTWATRAAFVGVVCGVVSLTCLGFLRFQYANMTATSLFDSTAIGWWVLVLASGSLVAQGIGGRPRPKVMFVVPQPPPFLQKSSQEILEAIPTDLSDALPPAPRLCLIQMGTNQVYKLDISRPVSIGRARQNDIVLTDDKVSRHHAVIRWQSGWMMIANQSQHAPLYLNQQSIQGEHPLRLGDTITLGQTQLQLISE
jgi:hypothetical protein